MLVEEGARGDLLFGTIPRLVRSSAERFGPTNAIVDGETALTYQGLAGSVRRASRALLALEVAPGDRVAIWAPNCWEWIVAALAIHSVGATLVPINTRFKGPEAAYVLAKSRARALFTVTDFLAIDYVAALRGPGISLPELRSIVVLRGKAPEGTLAFEAFLAGEGRISAETAEARAAAVRPEDVSDLIFTSGTTGNPKGVISTHAQSLRAYRDWSDTVGLRAGDRYLVVLPFFHTFGYKAGWLASLMMGATVFPEAVFEVGVVLSRVERDRITVLPGPPALYQSILARPDLPARDLSSLRLAVTGAAVVPVELIHRMRRELSFQTIITGYGLTESTGVATMCRVGDDPETIATTSGRAIPGVAVRVVDDDGRELPRGEPGEVVISGHTVMKGYWDDAAETAAAIDAGGWLHTGDIGVMDERGYLRITDRKKDMFIVGGFKAYPAEIENALLRHDAIAQVAVVGIPDERLGEVGMAFVVPRAGARLTADQLIAWSRDQMANFKVPRRVELVDALPMNATGKVLKFKLRERALRAGDEHARSER
jgi:acyl-CoA synthetase (AMP-forming)/AMP-acid ligase II